MGCKIGRRKILLTVGGGFILFLLNLWSVNPDFDSSSPRVPSASPALAQELKVPVSRHNHTLLPVVDDDSLPSVSPPPPSVDGSPRNHSMIYVHVGKTGGITLDKVLRSNCMWYSGAARRKKCLKALDDDHDGGSSNTMVSELSKATLHLGPRRDYNEWILNATIFLVTVRNPIARAVSASNFDHPSNNDPRRYAQGMPDSVKLFYIECFPTVQDLANLLQVADQAKQRLTKKQLTCYNSARRTLAGDGSRNGASHLRMNYAFYNELSMALFPDRPLLVLRTEYLWEDLARIDRMLGGNGYFPHVGKAYTHGSQSHAVQQGLSVQGKQTVCCYLASEMQIYEDLLRKAINLLPMEIRETLSEAYCDCGLNGPGLVDGRSFDWKEWASLKCPLSSSNN